VYVRAIPLPSGGTYRDRHDTWVRDAMDAVVSLDERYRRDGEIAWSWRPDAGVKPAALAMSALWPTCPKRQATEANKPALRGERV